MAMQVIWNRQVVEEVQALSEIEIRFRDGELGIDVNIDLDNPHGPKMFIPIFGLLSNWAENFTQQDFVSLKGISIAIEELKKVRDKINSQIRVIAKIKTKRAKGEMSMGCGKGKGKGGKGKPKPK